MRRRRRTRRQSLTSARPPTSSGCGGSGGGIGNGGQPAGDGGAVDNADEVLLPVVYKKVGASLRISLHGLTLLTLARSLAHSMSCLIAAALTKHFHRGTVIAFGAAAWGATTAAVARSLNGATLAWSAPAIYSMVADTAEAANRGVAFGLLRVAGISGMVIGGGAAIMLAGSAPAGIPAWRVAFLLTAAICFVLSAAIHAFVDDPHYSAGLFRKEMSGSGPGSLDRLDHLQQPSAGWRQVLDEMLADTWSMVTVPTFQIIVAQGMLGSFPWAALSFCTLWPELLGFEHASRLAPCWGAGSATLPPAGSQLAAVSAGSAALICILLIHGLPNDAPRPLLYAATLIPMGPHRLLDWVWHQQVSSTSPCISPCACNVGSPIKAEIVPQKLRSNMYAMGILLGSLPAAFAPCIVATIAEQWFGYWPVGKGLRVQEATLTTSSDAHALSHGLLLCTSLPWALCTLIYTLLLSKTGQRQRLANDNHTFLSGDDKSDSWRGGGGGGGDGIGGGWRWRQLALARSLSGIALAWTNPAIHSMVADTADAADQGLAFSWLRVAGNSGGIIGSGAAIMLVETAPAGIPGWRVAFLLTAAVCFVLAAAMYGFVEDPHSTAGQPSELGSLDHEDHQHLPGGGWRQVLDEMLADTRTVMGVLTVQVIVAQGMVGSFPGTAKLQISYHVATSVDALFGGLLGDIAARRLPNAGRITCAQFCSSCAAIIYIVLLYGLPTDAPRPLLHAATLIPMGLLNSWNGSATNNPIKAEIVPQNLRSSVYALDNALESLPASFAPLVVATIAERWYGYHPVGKGLALPNRSNTRALSHGLLACMTMPWIVCSAIDGLLYHHYPKDLTEQTI
eukprot:SM000080S22974  [mRNA]  locus=s80:427473:440278:- [translate_table: standard]